MRLRVGEAPVAAHSRARHPGSPGLVTTRDGVTISVARYGSGDRASAVLLCPGFFKSQKTPTFQRLVRALAHERDVLGMDFRGHGRSGGLYTFSAKEHADLEAVLAWARSRYDRLGILSFSLGAAIAINTVSRHPDRVQSLIAVSAPCAFEDIEFRWWTPEAIRRGVQGLEPGAGCRPGNPFLKKERPLDNVRALSPVAVCFIHGTRDVIVGVQHSRRLYAAASWPKRLVIVNGGSHAEALFRDDPRGFLALVSAWLATTLPIG